jgi:hypothetical protein
MTQRLRDHHTIEPAGVRLGIGDEFRKVRRRQRLSYAEYLSASADIGDRLEILVRIEIDLLKKRCQIGHRRGGEQQRIAIRLRARHLRHTNGTTCARAILNNKGPVEFCSESFGADPRHHVGIASRGDRHDNRHRPRRPIESFCVAGCEHAANTPSNKVLRKFAV